MAKPAAGPAVRNARRERALVTPEGVPLRFELGGAGDRAAAFLIDAAIILGVLLALIFAVMAFRARHPLERAGLALVVGGALGNIIDRLRQGAVTDFLDLYWRDWHWPTFNGADIAITLGALCILAASLPSHRRKEPVLDRN